MNYIYDIKLDKESEKPLYKQLANDIIKLVESGKLSPNSKLPPIRKLAEKMNVNKTTVVNAYKYLENRKVAYSKMGSGTYISEINLENLPSPILMNEFNTRKETKFELNESINFASGTTSENLFPVNRFKIFFNEVLDRDKGNAFSYQDTKGFLPLRESFSLYLNDYNIKSTPDKIQIISGAQQGLDIIAKAMLSFGDVVFVESPTYYGALGAFLSRGVQVVEIPVCNDGMDMDKLKSLIKIYNPKLIYIMSYFQTPTCISYSLKKKQELLEIANRYNTYIVEEDTQSDFVYTDEQLILLKSLDYKNKVIYIKSFSKILMPGLRIGFMVLPNAIINMVTSAKYNTDISTSGFIQRAFDLYLKGDELKKHTIYMRSIFISRYETANSEINKNLKGLVSYKKPSGGVSFWLKIRNNIDIEMLCNNLIKNNVVVTPGSIFSVKGENLPYIRISFANVEIEDIKKGIQIIGKILRDMNG